jgi:hypothetical protein
MTSTGEEPPRSDSPAVGGVLPRAEEAYTAPEKIAWILSEEGHGREWARVLHIGPDDAQRFWEEIAQAVLDGGPIFRVTERHGVTCGINIELQIGVRKAKTTTSWHYKHAHDAPRLVTAYPIG